MTDYQSPFTDIEPSVTTTKAKKPKRVPKQPATEKDFGDYVVDSAKWFGKEIVLDPLMWAGGMFSTPQYAITNLIAAPDDKKLSYIGQNLRHFVTLGIWKADEEAMTPPSTYLFGKQTTPFWSMDTAKRLVLDIVTDPLTYGTGLGILTKAGKFGGNVTRVAQKASNLAKKTGSKALERIADAKALFRAIAKGEDVVSIAKTHGDDFAKEMQLLVDLAGPKGVQLQDGFNDFAKIFKSEDRAIDNLFDWYNKSIHLGTAIEAMGPEMGQQYLRAISNNSKRFSQRQWIGLAFTDKNIPMGLKMKTLHDKLGVLATKMSGTMPGRMLTGVAKSLNEWRGKSVTKYNDALHEVHVGTGIGFGASMVPDQRMLERLRVEHGIDPNTGKAIMSMYEVSAGKMPTAEAFKVQAKRFGVDEKKFMAAYEDISTVRRHMDNEYKDWLINNGYKELAEKTIDKAQNNTEFLTGILTKEYEATHKMKKMFAAGLPGNIPADIRRMLSTRGIRTANDIANLTDEQAFILASGIKHADESKRVFDMVDLKDKMLREQNRKLTLLHGKYLSKYKKTIREGFEGKAKAQIKRVDDAADFVYKSQERAGKIVKNSMPNKLWHMLRRSGVKNLEQFVQMTDDELFLTWKVSASNWIRNTGRALPKSWTDGRWGKLQEDLMTLRANMRSIIGMVDVSNKDFFKGNLATGNFVETFDDTFFNMVSSAAKESKTLLDDLYSDMGMVAKKEGRILERLTQEEAGVLKSIVTQEEKADALLIAQEAKTSKVMAESLQVAINKSVKEMSANDAATDALSKSIVSFRDKIRGYIGYDGTVKTLSEAPRKKVDVKSIEKLVAGMGKVDRDAIPMLEQLRREEAIFSGSKQLLTGASIAVTETDITNAIKAITGYFPHLVDQDTARRIDFIHNMSVAKKADDFFAVPNEPNLFVMSAHARQFRAVNEGAYNAIKEAYGDSWNDEIARAVEDSVSIPLTAEESNLIMKNDKALQTKYLADLEKIAPERAEFLRKANWTPRGDISSTMADVLAAGDMTGVKTFFTEDPFFAVETWIKRESYAFSTEEATKAAILHYAKFSNELSPEQLKQGDWLPVGDLYAATEAVVPAAMKQEWKDAEVLRKILNHHMGKGDDIYKSIGKMDFEHQKRFGELLSRGLMDFNATDVHINGRIVIPKDAIDYLSKMKSSLNPRESGKLFRGIKELYSTLNKYWVMSALMRPAYHARNLISSMFMNLQYGVMPWEHVSTIQNMHYLNPEVIEKAGQAVQQFGKKSAAEGWASLKNKTIKTVYGDRDWQWVKHQMSKTVGNTTQIQSLYGEMGKLSPTQASRLIDKGTAYVKGMHFWAGGAVENTVRETAFVHFLKKGYTVNDAADMVKKIHYNYADLSYIDERIKNIFPFWAFVRKSIAGQLSVLNNKSVIRAFELKGLDARRRTQLPKELMPEYLSDAIGIETYRDENGTPHFFMLGGLFPFAEINKLALHPRKFINNFAQSLSPIIKEPVQQILNYDFFTEEKIHQWENQTGEYLGMNVPIRFRHAAMNIIFMNEISRLMWKDKPGYPAPSITEKFVKATIGLNLKPVDVKKQLARLEYKYRTQMNDLVANWKRTIRYGDSKNAAVILETLQANGHDTEKMITKHLKDVGKDSFQLNAIRASMEKAQLK